MHKTGDSSGGEGKKTGTVFMVEWALIKINSFFSSLICCL